MTIEDVLRQATAGSQEFVDVTPKGEKARKAGSLPTEVRGVYNGHYRALLIADDVRKAVDASKEFDEKAMIEIQRRLREFAFNGSNLFADAGYKQWLDSLGKN